MTKQPPEYFDGWRLDIDPIWESYNRIYFSYRRSESEREAYLKRLYRSHFVVFSYSFIDAIASKILAENFKFTKSQLKALKGLRQKIECLDSQNTELLALESYDNFWRDIGWLRNELVHPKRRDHSTAVELDKLDLGERIRLLNQFAVRAYGVANLEFPYWLTGWNSVNSMTSNSVDQGIVISNNSQFKVFMQMNGWRDCRYPLKPLEVVENYLVGEELYDSLLSFLAALNFDTQPLPDDIGFSLTPLWSRIWWDRRAMEDLRAYRESRSPYKATMR